MDPISIGLITALGVVVAVAAAAVLVVRLAMRGTDSHHRAAVLTAAADVIRAVRGRR
ncbi:hypothetical protein AB0D16_34475 [Streptomyces sp. NPDC048161]|uniref:hypothetical protein n=1 Tax=unclassified Streptomyces TaxID=2593676 RepID=UPI00081B254C|nr:MULTISPECIES: hypothetical protein [unclassified Streptomyces]SCD32189.1 hypothetical protein GA0115234_10048 [Streptomyces sp. DvalAA-43]